MFLQVCILIVMVVAMCYKLMERPEGLPPGDWGYPIIGKLPNGRKGLIKLIEEQRRKYGNIFSVKIGSTITIFLADFQLIKTAFSKLELSGRPTTRTFKVINFQSSYGLVLSNSHIWQENRRFALKTLRDFGLGKSRIQEVIEIEVGELIKDLSARVNKPTTIDWALNGAILNVIWQLTADKRYDIHDKEIQEFWERLLKIFDIMQGQLNILDFMPWTEKFLPRFVKNWVMRTDELDNHLDFLKRFFASMVEEHRKTFNKNTVRDYIDAYILDLEESGAEDQNAYKHDFMNLTTSVQNLFFAGTDTTSSTMRWFFLYMCKYQEIQEKIQSDIDLIVGRDKIPSLEDRERLPYFEASIYEVMRHVSFVPNAIAHFALEDTTLGGYKIPKGAIVFPCIDLCHMSPDYFDHPSEFRPERFLDSEGKLMTKKEGYLPFSIGRRLCLGESLAKVEQFLFGSAVLQKFKISVPEDDVIDLTPEISAFFNYPKPYRVIFQER